MKNMKKKQKGLALSSSKGFTLIEILIVIGLIAILATVVLVALNPARQFKQARDSQRVSNVNTILNAVGQRIADNKGIYKGAGCNDLPLTASTTVEKTMSSTAPSYNMYPCIIPNYIAALPVDPSLGIFNSPADYNTEYTIEASSTTGRITVTAPSTELASPVISVTR